jgi:hypothetical protein
MAVEELNEVYSKIENIQENLNSFLDPDRELRDTQSQVAVTMRILFGKAIQYVREMMSADAMSMSPENRRLLSRNLVKSLDFTKVERDSYDLQKLIALSPDMDDYADLEDIDDGPDDGEFTVRPFRRETSEAAARPRGQFDVDDRQVFGFNSGAYFGEPFSTEGEVVYDRVAQPTEGTDVAEAPRMRVSEIPEMSMRSRFDPDTQAFNVDMPGRELAPSVAPEPVRRKLRTPAEAPARKRIAPTRVEGKVEVAPAFAQATVIPMSRDDLPTTIEGFDRLAKTINSMREGERPTKNKQPIVVNAGSQLRNIRLNFIRRLGLV